MDARFSYDLLVASADRPGLVASLRSEITRRLLAATDPEAEARVVIEELRQLGHDLWSFDESDEFQAWCGNWVHPKYPYELIVEMSYRAGQAAVVSVTFQERRSR